MQLSHEYIFHNIWFSSRIGYSWTREIHTIGTMGIIISTRRTINMSFGKPKNLFFFEVQKVICERWPRHVIFHNYRKFSKITQPLGPPQQQFIPIRSMTRWTTLQVLSIQCKLFESTNVIIGHHYVWSSVAFPQLLQLNVMHSFYQITSGHVYPLFITKLL